MSNIFKAPVILAIALIVSTISGCANADEINRRLDALTGKPSAGAVSAPLPPESVTAEKLIQSNRLPDILCDGRIIKSTALTINDETYEDYYLTYGDGRYVILSDHGYKFAFCDGLEFWPDPETGRIKFSYIYFGDRADELRYNYANRITGILEYYVDYEITVNDGSILEIRSETASGDMTHELTARFDASDLSMTYAGTKTVSADGSQYVSETGYEKTDRSDIPADLLSLLSELDRSDKKTVTYGEYDRNDGKLRKIELSVPSNWEFSVLSDEYAWMDDGCTIPYEYPGDGIDYTLIMNYAKG